MVTNRKKQVLALVKKKGVLRAKDLEEEMIARTNLRDLYEEGLLESPARGLYIISETNFGSHQTLVEVSRKIPKGVICLLSALQFYKLTTQSPFEVWMAIENKARTSRLDSLPVRFVRFSGKALTAGVEEHKIKSVTIKIYSPAKTVADCFKYRNKIGLDVAIEALRECRRKKKCSMDEIWKYAKICRVSNIMSPYMEMLG